MEEVLVHTAKIGVRPVRWTRAQYERMAETGVLHPEARVELIDGRIIEMSPQSTIHSTGIRAVEESLRSAFGAGYDVRVQLPLAVGDEDEPEPDVSVVKGSFREYADRHPATAVLVVEISDTSLAYDQLVKSKLYARVGIQEYWVVNLVDRLVEVYRDPSKDVYRQKNTYYRDAVIAPLERPDTRIKVADLLP